jgi:hypothetical protein
MVSVLMESIPVPNHPVEEERRERGGDAEEEGDDDVFHIGFLSVCDWFKELVKRETAGIMRRGVKISAFSKMDYKFISFDFPRCHAVIALFSAYCIYLFVKLIPCF